MSLLLVAPIAIPLSAAVVSLLAWRSTRTQRAVSVIGSAALLVASLLLLRAIVVDGIQATQIGGWPAPFGITLVADLFSAIMVVLGGVMALSVTVYSLGSIDAARERFSYYPLLQMLIAGVSGAFLTGDLFNLYVWFEVMLMASFVMLALGGERSQIRGATAYVTLNLISSALFLAGVGVLYGVGGTLNMADLARKLDAVQSTPAVTATAMLFLVAFGIKAALFPLFFWLPASYHTPPFAVSAIFAGLLTKVGVYALIRVFTLLFVHDIAYTHSILLGLAALTMVTGVLGAIAQDELRRILSFHIVSQIGYMVMGLGLFTRLALAGSVFYIVHHIIVKANLFLVSGVVQRLGGSSQLASLGGLYQSRPLIAALFLVPALSLAGLPPLSGFFAKLALVRSGLERAEYLVTGVALVVSLLTLLSMMKIWTEVFWKSGPAGSAVSSAPRPGMTVLLTPIACLGAVTVLIGVGAGPLFDLSLRAAEQLLDRREYIRAVLGDER
jgi:multicomponent Na+:H+ antiporter subunit D